MSIFVTAVRNLLSFAEFVLKLQVRYAPSLGVVQASTIVKFGLFRLDLAFSWYGWSSQNIISVEGLIMLWSEGL